MAYRIKLRVAADELRVGQPVNADLRFALGDDRQCPISADGERFGVARATGVGESLRADSASIDRHRCSAGGRERGLSRTVNLDRASRCAVVADVGDVEGVVAVGVRRNRQIFPVGRGNARELESGAQRAGRGVNREQASAVTAVVVGPVDAGVNDAFGKSGGFAQRRCVDSWRANQPRRKISERRSRVER